MDAYLKPVGDLSDINMFKFSILCLQVTLSGFYASSGVHRKPLIGSHWPLGDCKVAAAASRHLQPKPEVTQSVYIQ